MRLFLEETSSAQNKRWRGLGMVSANNSSRLLLDYKALHPERYWEILALVFGAEGLAVSHLKLEMGADINSSSGTEPCTMRTADERCDVTRGAGFVLAADAKKINPGLTLDLLWWGEPVWIERAGDGADFDEATASQEKRDAVYAARYEWYRANLVAAWETFALRFDYVSATQNERGWYPSWIRYLSGRLKVEKDAPYDFAGIKIVAGEEVCTWNQADLMLSDAALCDAVDVIGSHYTSWSSPAVTELRERGKEVWMSEGSSPMVYAPGVSRFDGSGLSGLNGALDIAIRLITMYAKGCMTLCELQPVVAAYYDGVTYCSKQLITANTPWNGFYELDAGFYMALHFSQFIKKGWGMIDGACLGDGVPGGDGHCITGSTYNALSAYDGRTGDFSVVIANDTEQELTYTLELAADGQLARAAEKNGVRLWETRGHDGASGKPFFAHYFQNLGTLSGSKTDGMLLFSLAVRPYSLVTLSTLDCAVTAEGLRSRLPAENPVLRLSYADDFSYRSRPQGFLAARGGAPLFTTDEGGAFEVVQRDGENVLLQKITLEQKAKEWGWTSEPVTCFGDDRWNDYRVQARILLCGPEPGCYAGIGLRYTLGDIGHSGLWLQAFADGRLLVKKNDTAIFETECAVLAQKAGASQWILLSLEICGTMVTAAVDGKPVAHISLAEQKNAAPCAGRAALFSSWHKNCFADVRVLPCKNPDAVPYITRFDDTDSCFCYAQTWEHSLMDSFRNYRRTLSMGGPGAECAVTFRGTGFRLTGTTSGCSLLLQAEGLDETVAVQECGSRDTLCFAHNLRPGEHRVLIKVLEGTVCLDAIEILGDLKA